MANNSTFRLIEGALELGVNIREVSWWFWFWAPWADPLRAATIQP